MSMKEFANEKVRVTEVEDRFQASKDQKRWILFAFGILLCLGIGVALNRIPGIPYQSDLFSRWYATTKLLDSGRNVYDLQNGREAIQYKAAPTTPLEAGFYYPAHLLVFMVPLAVLPFWLAHLVWTVSGLLFLFLGVWIVTAEEAWPHTINQRTVFVLLSMLFIPVIQHAIWSQFDALGVAGLALSYRELRRGRYEWAGLWAAGLTFKPQGSLLALGFLLAWSLLHRDRWRFAAGFGVSILGLWGLAEFFQRGWVVDFWGALQEYGKLPYTIQSDVDKLWNPHQVLAIMLVILTMAAFLYCRNANPGSPAFRACIALSLGVWWLVIPVIGMLHLVMLPIALVLLLSGLNEISSHLYPYAIIAFLLIYFLGIAGFLYGLSNPGLYGMHIQLAEAAYKITIPLLIVGFSLPLIIQRSTIGVSS